MKWLRNLTRSAFPAAAPEIDLHGLRVPEALHVVQAALREAECAGAQSLRIVCGKGRGSPGGVGVLRDVVAGWLEVHGYADRFRREVDRDGRDGAIRVHLGPAAEAGPE